MEVTVKAFLQREDGNVEVRRVSVGLKQDDTMFKTMANKVAAAFPGLNGKALAITWEDQDGDLVLMSTDEELQDALSQSDSGLLKINVSEYEHQRQTDNGDTTMTEDTPSSDNPQSDSNKGRHDREMPSTPRMPVPDHGMPPPPPPPFCGMPPPPPPPPFHRGMFGHGVHGGHGWNRGRGRHQGQGHCHRMRRWGPQVGPWGPTFGQRWAGRGPWGPMFGRNWTGCGLDQGAQDDTCELKIWKKTLRESVPVSHRRWAKRYVHDWRGENIRNATTSSSDSGMEKNRKAISKEEAGVPEAYVVWLDMALNKFHNNWDNVASLGSAHEDLSEDDGEDCMATLQMSVPVEFRKWMWWYLCKRYGKRQAPSFGKCEGSEHEGHHKGKGQTKPRCHQRKEHCNSGKKAWNRGQKLHFMASMVPCEFRRWAKRFIMTWRIEHQLPTTQPCHFSDSDDDVTAKDAGVPEDYTQWLLKFLPRWHVRKGQLDEGKVEVPAGKMFDEKDSVPMEFRAWARCFLNQRCHLNEVNKKDPKRPSEADEDQYRRWLGAFKLKWTQQHDEDLDLTSSGDDTGALALTSETDTDSEMHTSFKRLRLDQNAQDRKVRFDVTLDNSDSEDDMLLHKKLGHPGFKQMARRQLFDWDGSCPTDLQDGSTELPPHVYNWLCRLMVRAQKKKMKQQLRNAKLQIKTAKREMKAAAKARRDAQP